MPYCEEMDPMEGMGPRVTVSYHCPLCKKDWQTQIAAAHLAWIGEQGLDRDPACPSCTKRIMGLDQPTTDSTVGLGALVKG